MKIGDTVQKISGKPFQNGMKTAIVESLTKMIIPEARDKIERNGPTKEVDGVNLVRCVGPVRTSQLEVKQ